MILPVFLSFYNKIIFEGRTKHSNAKELPISSPDPITSPAILTPSPILPPSLLFDPRYIFIPEKLLPPKKRICSPSSSSTTPWKHRQLPWQVLLILWSSMQENGETTKSLSAVNLSTLMVRKEQ
ncbi:hypothetical protein Tco_0456461 [Tanacetum coccineum]